MSKKALREAIDTYYELLRVHQLNIELLNTLELTLFSIRDFCRENNIPFGNAKVGSLLEKVDSVFDEISLSDDSYHDNESDDKLTEPCLAFFGLECTSPNMLQI